MMPTPCTNCVRFHYGQCSNQVRQCYICAGFGHIERYCPNKRHTIQRVKGEPLAGTRAWQEMHGLQHDPELRNMILQALKTSPGSAIYVNNVCIYAGNDRHFKRREEPRGRSLLSRISGGPRLRTRSPVYGRFSRSTPAGRNRSRSRDRGYDMAGYNRRYRSRSPIHRRRTPSPYGVQERRPQSPSPYRNLEYRPTSPAPRRQVEPRARSPKGIRGSNAVVYERRAQRKEDQNYSGTGLQVKFSLPPLHESQKPTVAGFQAPPARGPLEQVTTNIPRTAKTASNQGKLRQNTAGADMTTKAESPASASTLRSADEVEDPHFVLGITSGAQEAEIVTAFQQRMEELESERNKDGSWDMGPNNIWDESIRILQAAKKQLLGF